MTDNGPREVDGTLVWPPLGPEDRARVRAQEEAFRGGWYEPAIPLPFYGWPFMLRKVCFCGRKFWKSKSYERHFVDAHQTERAS